MKPTLWIKNLPLALLGLALVATATAWQNRPPKTKQINTDTVPDRNKKARDIDEALEELDRSKAEVDRSLKEIDFGKIEKQIREATENMQLNAAQMQEELNRAMKEVDAAKIQTEVQKALTEAQASLKEIDSQKMQAEMKASLAKVDWSKIQEEISKAKAVDIKKLQEDIQKIRPELEKSMKEAHKGIEKARKEVTGYKNFIDGLDKDGLINKKEPYTIQYKGGELTINGKKQSSEVVNKYSSFLKGRKDFTIKKEAYDFH